jgi:hypothetical protein
METTPKLDLGKFYTFDPVKFMWWLMYVSYMRMIRIYPGPVVTEWNRPEGEFAPQGALR